MVLPPKSVAFIAMQFILFMLIAMPVRADTPEDSFASLFGDEAKQVDSSHDAKAAADFAKKLLDSAAGLSADQAFQEFLYNKAYEYGIRGPAGFATADQAMQSLATADPDLKSQADEKRLALAEKQYNSVPSAERRNLAGSYLSQLIDVGDSRSNAGDIEGALELYRKAIPIASVAGSDQGPEILEKIKNVTARRTVTKNCDDLKIKLKQAPDDAKTAAELVTLLLIELDQPEEAAKYADKLSDSDLKHIITLANQLPTALPETDCMSLADWYYAHALKAEIGKPAALAHADTCYQQVLSIHFQEDVFRLKAKLGADKVAQALSSLTPRNNEHVVNLLKLVDVRRDSVHGTWVLSNGTLVSDHTQDAQIEFPYQPPLEYDYRFVFTREDGNDFVSPLLWAGHPFQLFIGAWVNTTTSFEKIDGTGSFQNATTRRSSAWLQNGQRYTCVIKVRKDRVQAYLDDKLMTEWKTDYSDLSQFAGRRQPNSLGFEIYQSKTVFYSVEVLEITGKGKLLGKQQ